MIPARRSRQRGGVALLVIGCLMLLVGLGLLSGGGVLLWADRTQRDAQGYIDTGSERLQTSGYALVSRDLAVDVPGWLVGPDRLGRIQVSVTAPSGQDVFVGIAPRGTVDGYLAGVARDEVSNWTNTHPGYTFRSGGAPATTPGSQPFWAAKASGPGTQTLTWVVLGGTWSVVAMNADASPGVVVDAAAGATAPFLLAVSSGLLAAGFVIAAVALLLVVLGARSRPPVAPAQHWGAAPPAPAWSPSPPPTAPTAGVSAMKMTVYPVAVEGHLDEPLNRWLWLVKWLLVIPHIVVLVFLGIVAFVLTVVAWFCILFTARYPRAIFDFNLGVLRWWWRVGFYSYSALGTDRYPPFSLGPEPDYPARLDIAYPERLSRGLVLVKSWLLAIPQLIVVGILGGGFGHYGGVTTLLVLVAGILLLSTQRYNRDIFNLVMGFNRWSFRVIAYVALMRDEYPPFRLDPGETEPEPGTTTAAPVPPAAPSPAM